VRRQGLHLGFVVWARRVLPPASPAIVKRHFDRHGVVYTAEFWRKLLNGEIKQVNLATWMRICDVAGEPLRYFVDYEPADNALPTARPLGPRPRRTATRPNPTSAIPRPPSIHDYLPRTSK